LGVALLVDEIEEKGKSPFWDEIFSSAGFQEFISGEEMNDLDVFQLLLLN